MGNNQALDALARRIIALEKEARAQKLSSLQNRAIQGGALKATDNYGSTTMLIGGQFDGTSTTVVVNGPIPPTPSIPQVIPALEGAVVTWDGFFEDPSTIVPMDFARVEVHASTDPMFTAEFSATLVGTYETPRGGALSITLVPSTYYIKFVTRTQGGLRSAASAPATVHPDSIEDVLVPSLPLSDGVAPTLPGGWAPTLSTFAVGSLDASWPAVPNTDRVTYDVYLNEGAAVTVFDSTTFIGSTTATRLPISRRADGTALRPDTDYYLAVKVRDDDGPATGTGTDGPVQYRKADIDLISAAWVYANAVQANQIQSGSITADWGLLGSLQVGPNISLKPPATSPADPGGLKIVTGGLVGGVMTPGAGLILLPGDGTAALFRKVALEADSLLVYDNFELRGFSNKISGTLKLAKGVEAFQAGPTVVSDWTDPTIRLDLTTTSGVTGFGPLADDGANWVTLSNDNKRIVGYDKSTGAETTLLTVTAAGLGSGANFIGVTKLGATWYVLSRNTSANITSRYEVDSFDSSWTSLTGWLVSGVVGGASSNIPQAISSDAVTGLLYISFRQNSAKTIVRSVTTAGASLTVVMTTPAVVPGDLTGFAPNGDPYPQQALCVGSADFGAQRFVLGYGSTLQVYSAASGGTRVTTSEWAKPNGESQSGVYYDGTNFRVLSAIGRVWKLSRNATSVARSVRASKYDSVGTIHETAWSLPTSFTHNPREWMKVQTAAPDGSGGADEPNRIRHYIQTASLNVNYYLQSDVTASPWAAWYDIPAVGTATAVTGVDFSSVASYGKITDSTGGYYFDGGGRLRAQNFVGVVAPFAGSTAPTGALLCDGASYLVATYPDLFAVIGYTYGGSGANFNVPNLKGRAIVGQDASQVEFDTLGETGGAKTHTLTAAQIPQHTHDMSHGHSNPSSNAIGTAAFIVRGSTAGSLGNIGATNSFAGNTDGGTGGGGAHNNLQPYIALNYIIYV